MSRRVFTIYDDKHCPVQLDYGYDGPLNAFFVDVWKVHNAKTQKSGLRFQKPLWQNWFDPAQKEDPFQKYRDVDVMLDELQNLVQGTRRPFKDEVKAFLRKQLVFDKESWVDERTPAMRAFQSKMGDIFQKARSGAK